MASESNAKPKNKTPNRKPSCRYLALAIEHILLSETDADKGKAISYQGIRTQLEKRFNIVVSKNTVEKTVLEMADWYGNVLREYQGFSGDYDLFVEDLVGKSISPERVEGCAAKGRKSNKKHLVCIQRDEDLPGEIEHLVRYLRSLSSENADSYIEKLLLSQLDEETREEILQKAESQPSSVNSKRLGDMLLQLQKLEYAIADRRWVDITYEGDKGDAKKYLPLAVHFDGEHYYLAAKARSKAKVVLYDENGRRYEARQPRIFRVDRIKKVDDKEDSSDKKGQFADAGQFAKFCKDARAYLKAGVCGTFSGGTVPIRIKCRKEAKVNLIKSAFGDKQDFEDDSMDKMSFTCKASFDGAKRWAIRFKDVAEVRVVGEDNLMSSQIVQELADGAYGDDTLVAIFKNLMAGKYGKNIKKKIVGEIMEANA